LLLTQPTPFPYTTLFRSHILKQHPGRLVANDLRIFKHKLNAHALVFDGWEIPDLGFVTPKMKQYRCWFGSYLQLATSGVALLAQDRKSTRLNSSHVSISY